MISYKSYINLHLGTFGDQIYIIKFSSLIKNVCNIRDCVNCEYLEALEKDYHQFFSTFSIENYEELVS